MNKNWRYNHNKTKHNKTMYISHATYCIFAIDVSALYMYRHLCFSLIFWEFLTLERSDVGVTNHFFPFHYFPCFFFQKNQNVCYLLNIMFIFDRCHSNLAAGTPAKYDHDSNDLIYPFTKTKITLLEKLWAEV